MKRETNSGHISNGHIIEYYAERYHRIISVLSSMIDNDRPSYQRQLALIETKRTRRALQREIMGIHANHKWQTKSNFVRRANVYFHNVGDYDCRALRERRKPKQ